MSSIFLLRLMSSLVASICPLSAASVMAATATFAVSAAVVAGILEMAWPESRRGSSAGAALAGGIAIAWAVMPAIARGQNAIVATAALPRDLSRWGMYLNADPVVKAVLIGLALASVLTWTVCLAKALEIFLAKRDVEAALNTLAGVRSPAEGMERLAEGE